MLRIGVSRLSTGSERGATVRRRPVHSRYIRKVKGNPDAYFRISTLLCDKRAAIRRLNSNSTLWRRGSTATPLSSDAPNSVPLAYRRSPLPDSINVDAALGIHLLMYM